MSVETITRLIREMTCEVRAKEGAERTLTFRGTTENVARDGGILRAAGGNFDEFDANPVVLWSHGRNSEQPVIGKVTERRLDEGARAWDFDIEFATKEESELADQVFRLASKNMIRAASIGFEVTKYRKGITPEERDEMGLPPWGWVGEEWNLHELSVVPVGADPGALKRALDDGDVTEEEYGYLIPETVAFQVEQTMGTAPATTSNSFHLVGETPEWRQSIGNVGTSTFSFPTRNAQTDELIAALRENTESNNELRAAILDGADEEIASECEVSSDADDRTSVAETRDEREEAAELRAAFDDLAAKVARYTGHQDDDGTDGETGRGR